MVVKFPSELFEWIKEECGEKSPAAFVVELVGKYKTTGPQKGAIEDDTERKNKH